MITPRGLMKHVLARVATHLPEGEDYFLIVLKGHLLIEERLESIIRAAVEAPKHLGERQSFALRLRLAKALRWSHADPAIWAAVEKINFFRNAYAHRSEFGTTVADMDAWTLRTLREYGKMGMLLRYPELRDVSGSERLRSVILLTYVCLKMVDDSSLAGNDAAVTE